MNIESWCSVELTPDMQWTRKERKHNKEAFKSTVFDSHEEGHHTVERCKGTLKPTADKLDNYKKRRHFSQKCEGVKNEILITSYIFRLYTFKVNHD